MPVAQPLPLKTTIVFDTFELVRLCVVLEAIEESGQHKPELARLHQAITAALAAPTERRIPMVTAGLARASDHRAGTG